MNGARVFPVFGSANKQKKKPIIEEETNEEFSTLREAPKKGASQLSFMKAPRMIYKGHMLAVRSVTVLVTPDREDSLVFSGGDDKIIFVWSLKTGEKVAELSGHAQRVVCMDTYQSSATEPFLISGSWDEKLRIWPLRDCFTTQTTTDSNNKEESITALSEKLSGQAVVLKGHTNRIFGCTVVNRSGETPFVASASADTTIRVWALPDGHLLYVLEDDEDATWNLCISSWFIADNEECPYAGTVLLSGCKNTTVRVWHHRVETDAAASNASPTRNISIADKMLSFVTSAASAAKASSAARTTPDLVLTGHTSAVHTLAPFDYQEQPFVVTACKDLDIRVFSLLTGALVKTLRGHTNAIGSIAVQNVSNARGGAIIVSSSREGANMRVWKYSTGECLRFFKGHTQDINAVHVFPSPDSRRDDLVIVSASKDTTVRTWLLAEEKALKVLDHGTRQRIKAMDVMQREGDSIVVTGAEDGTLRAWRAKRDEGDEEHSALEWKAVKAHKGRVLALCIYTPLPDDEGYYATQVNKNWPPHLHMPLVFSSARSGEIRVCSFKDGIEVMPVVQAHSGPVTSLAVCSGARGNAFHTAVDPFLVSGSEDNTAIIWSLVDFTKLQVLEGHIFDVTCVGIFLPPPLTFQQTQRPRGASGTITPRENASLKSPDKIAAPDALIMTGSMDSEVRVWSFSTAECLAVLNSAESHITCLTCLKIEKTSHTKHDGLVVIAGDGYGNIFVWSLAAPYKLLFTLRGHSDEVRSVYAYDAEGIPPVLVSGSLDCTVKVWNLETMKLNKTMEGHTSDVTVVRVFNLGGSDLALVSASLDATARVEFNFMEASPQLDVVMQLFLFDLNGTNIHVMAGADSAYPRIAALAKKEGAEQFFGSYYALFGAALRKGRCDFLEEFLSQSFLGLVKSNRGKTTDKDEMEGEYDGLLKQALDRQDSRAVRIVIDCWRKFYEDGTSELIHEEENRISMSDMLQLAQEAPAEFERLICSIKLVPVKDNSLPPSAYFLYQKDSENSTYLGRMPSEEAMKTAAKKAKSAGTEVPVDEKAYLYLPIVNAAHMDMLYAYCATCDELDSVEIFNSDVGKYALSYAWRRMGLRAHLVKMAIYLFFVALSTVSLLTFNNNIDDIRTKGIAVALVIAQLCLDAFFVMEERNQFFVNPVVYLSDIWNTMDFIVVASNVGANVLRLIYLRDVTAGKVLLCITSIVGYFNILYFLRAFESTGPLVSMILRISNDMKYLIVVVLIVLFGFSQAFWIISSVDQSLPFGTFENSLLNSYSFMLGGFDPSAFVGTPLNSFAIALSCFYMLIVSILLLNLLIALMGDSYGSVKEKGLAQWMLEQAQIVTEMQGSMSTKDRQCSDMVYFRTNRLEPVVVDEDRTGAMESTIQELKYSQKRMMKLLLEQQDRMQQQMELHEMLKEFIAKTQSV